MEIVNNALRSLVAGSLLTSMQAQASSLVEKSNLVALFSSIIILKPCIIKAMLHNTKRKNLKISNNPGGVGSEHGGLTLGLARSQHCEGPVIRILCR